eukprot:2313896-Amphidinium_carterae.1
MRVARMTVTPIQWIGRNSAHHFDKNPTVSPNTDFHISPDKFDVRTVTPPTGSFSLFRNAVGAPSSQGCQRTLGMTSSSEHNTVSALRSTRPL